MEKKIIDKFPPIGKKTAQTYFSKRKYKTQQVVSTAMSTQRNLKLVKKLQIQILRLHTTWFLTGMQANLKHLTTTLVEAIQQQNTARNVNKRDRDTAKLVLPQMQKGIRKQSRLQLAPLCNLIVMMMI